MEVATPEQETPPILVLTFMPVRCDYATPLFGVLRPVLAPSSFAEGDFIMLLYCKLLGLPS